MEVDGVVEQEDYFSLPFVRRRIDLLAAELARLDGDPHMFAKAFRLYAARTAYQELLAEAMRLAASPAVRYGRAGPVDVDLDLEVTRRPDGMRCEVIDL